MGSWLGLGCSCGVGWPDCVSWIGFLSISSLFCLGLKWSFVLSFILSPFLVHFGYVSCKPCKTSETPKLVKYISVKALFTKFGVVFM
jgi:hypothetical protein